MISIKKYLSLNTESDRSSIGIVRTLVQGIGRHTVAGQTEDIAQLRESIREVSDALVEGIGPQELGAHAETVLKALGDHNRRAVWFQRFQTSELQNMVKMLTSALGAVAATGETNTRILGNIERQVAVVSDLDDVRVMKAKLSNCLADIRAESLRQRTETEDTIKELRRGLNKVRMDHIQADQFRDPTPLDDSTQVSPPAPNFNPEPAFITPLTDSKTTPPESGKDNSTGPAWCWTSSRH